MNDLINSIKKLRLISGAGFLDCKKVLEENDNDIEKSIDSLRKKGLAKASKKSLRKANDGAVGIFFNKNKALLLEINTETDFAAKNDIFLNFFEKIGNFALSINNYSEILIDEFMLSSFEELSISEHFTEAIAKIGENIVLIVAAGEHRGETFKACEWAIAELKRTTPIWKRETTSTGEVWVQDTP